jgi:hypothetical protein
VRERVTERYALIGCSSDEHAVETWCEERDRTAAGRVRGVFVSMAVDETQQGGDENGAEWTVEKRNGRGAELRGMQRRELARPSPYPDPQRRTLRISDV